MSPSDYREVTVCRLCDSPALLPVLTLPDTPLANELGGTELFPLQVNRCDSCEHHQLSIAVSPERLWGPNYPYQSGTSPVFRKHLEALADEVAALKPGGRVLEIASNDGTLCRMLGERRMHAYGVDPSGEQKQDELCSLEQGSWPEAARCYKSEAFDVIIALNVFAHVNDLHSFTAAVKEALAPDGVFIVEVGYFPYVCEDGLFDTVYHEHMSYHAARPLKRFFARHGLSLVRWVTNDSQGGSIRCYVRHSGEDPVGLNEDGESNAWLLRERMVLTKTGLVLALGGTAGLDNIAGYGCPAKLTTLMYATGLDRERITCIYDDNPLKVGKLTPGTLIPILPSANLFIDAPDTLILFAWNFASEIIPRLRAQGYKGRIITPLPEVEVDEL